MSDWLSEANETLVPFYNRFPLAIVRGKKHYVWDDKGRRYLDFTTGISVVNFGHADKDINQAVIRQIKKISHISNLYFIPGQMKLAKKIQKLTFPGRAFFCNSGAEANEAALKIARLYGNQLASGKSKILALNGSFHGRTIATITLTGQSKYRKGFEPLLDKVEFVGLNNIEDLRTRFTNDVCAVFLEAVQGEGGITKLDPEFINEIKRLAKEKNALIIFDEIQCGMGRTGKAFGYQNFDIEPDIISMAKALGNGFPIGAVWVRPAVSDAMPAGMHASTFGGNFAACAAGIASVSKLTPALLSHVSDLGVYFKEKLEKLKSDFPDKIKENRVYGLMIGVDLHDKTPVKDLIQSLMNKGILTLRAGNNVLRLLPAFTITRKEIDYFITILRQVLEGVK